MFREIFYFRGVVVVLGYGMVRCWWECENGVVWFRFDFDGVVVVLGYGIIRGCDCQVKWQNGGDCEQEQEVQHKRWQ